MADKAKEFDGKELALLFTTIILPPLGVFLQKGISAHFWLNLILTFFGFWVCGIVHGLYVLLKK
jgi:uncharacterized membrane protein YqaE (UPF0057 family)